MIGDVIREQVRQACGSKENVFGPSFFDQHLAVVAECAGSLAECLGADAEIVSLAAYLHDIAAVRDAAAIPDHARLSADAARRMLTEQGYPSERTDRVARCIASHSSPLAVGGGSLEEICVSNADAMSRIVRPAYWLFFTFAVRKQGFEEGRQWLLGLVESQWECLVQPAKELVGDRYAAARKMLATAG